MKKFYFLIGLKLLVSFWFLTPVAFASNNALQLDSSVYTHPPVNSGFQQALGSGLSGNFNGFDMKIGSVSGGGGEQAPRLIIKEYSSPDYGNTSLITTWTASSTGDLLSAHASSTYSFTGAQFGSLTFNPNHYYCVSESNSSVFYNIYGSAATSSFANGKFTNCDASNYRNDVYPVTYNGLNQMYFILYTGLFSPQDSIRALYPIDLISNWNPIYFKQAYTTAGADTINLTLNYHGLNNDGVGAWSDLKQISTIPNTLTGSHTFEETYTLPAGYYDYRLSLSLKATGNFSTSSPTYFFHLINEEASGTVAYLPTFTYATSGVSLPSLTGYATSTCTGDLLTDFGCNFKNGLAIFGNFLLLPDKSAFDYFSAALIKLESDFPFNIFFNLNTYGQGNLAIAPVAQEIIIPQSGVWPQVTLVSSSTLVNVFGTTTVDSYFTTAQNSVWALVGLAMLWTVL